jgi:hypothetical protein
MVSRATRGAGLIAAALFALPAPAHADSRLEARYTLTVARIPIGALAWSADIGPVAYATAASGAARGVLRIITSGKGTLRATGLIRDGRPLPETFESETISEDETVTVRMDLDSSSTVKELSVGAPLHADRVPLTDAHRRGVIDPLSALLAPAARSGEVVSAEPCERTLPIFDGTRRFDIRLSFKRFETMKVARGFQGPGVICAVAFQAIAGHRASSPLVSYLSGGRDMELWLAPIAGSRMLAPIRLSITSMLGDLVLTADQFEVAVTPVTRPTGSNVGTR